MQCNRGERTGVFIHARVAATIPRAEFDRFRASIRGVDREVDDLLVQLVKAASAWKAFSSPFERKKGTKLDDPHAQPEQLNSMGTKEAAKRLGMKTTRRVRAAIEDNRLAAGFTGTRWRITEQAIQAFEANRAA